VSDIMQKIWQARINYGDINRTSERKKKLGIHGDGRHCVVLASVPHPRIRDVLVGGVNSDHGKERTRGWEWAGSVRLAKTCAKMALNVLPFEWRAGPETSG